MTTRAQKAALVALIIPAAVAIWGGWVGLGRLSGFGPVPLLPGIYDPLEVDLAITLPISVEAYAALALGVWLGRVGSSRAQSFARLSALAAMVLGMTGQIAYHLLAAAGATHAPTPVVIMVSILPVLTLTAAASLLHLLPEREEETVEQPVEVVPEPTPEPSRQPMEPAPQPTAQPPSATAPRALQPPPGSKKESILALLREQPEASADDIADRVGCAPRYVRDVRTQWREQAA